MKNEKSEYTKDNTTIIVEAIYTEDLTIKDILKEYIKQKITPNMGLI